MSEDQKISLRDAYLTVLGGVLACSPKRYENSLQAIARMTGRTVDDEFRTEIRIIENSIPCHVN